VGAGVGPIGQALENVVFRIDALNKNSYSGSGNTINSLVVDDKLSTAGVTFISSGGESVFVFGGAGFVTSGKNTGVSGTQSRTMAAWVKFGQKSTQGVMCVGANGSGTGMALETSSTVWNLGRGNTGTATTVTYNLHQWYYAVYVSDFITGTTHNIKLYINGGLAHTAIATGINLTNSTLKIGCNNGGVGVSGQIARVNFYNKSLSLKEIQKNYQNYKKRFGLS
jgi:hypothetical protein